MTTATAVFVGYFAGLFTWGASQLALDAFRGWRRRRGVRPRNYFNPCGSDCSIRH